MEKGKFIVVEGPDGSGKSTLIETFKKENPEFVNNDRFVFLKEPSDATDIGKFARNWVHTTDTMTSASCVTKALYLFSAGRMELVDKVINPALALGKTVISDRFALSSAVYQDLLPEWKTSGVVKAVLDDLVKYVKVDATIFCMADPKTIVSRLRNRSGEGEETDAFNDSRDVSFFEALNLKYMLILYGTQIDKALIGDVYVMDANKPKHGLYEEFETTVKNILKQQ